ncbi:MAG TPA: hypothetical protein VF323_05755 [Candidatus Limnocylindrales bacterium]
MGDDEQTGWGSEGQATDESGGGWTAPDAQAGMPAEEPVANTGEEPTGGSLLGDEIEVAWCYYSEAAGGYTSTIYAASREKADKKAGVLVFCHAGRCQTDSPITEACE